MNRRRPRRLLATLLIAFFLVGMIEPSWSGEKSPVQFNLKTPRDRDEKARTLRQKSDAESKAARVAAKKNGWVVKGKTPSRSFEIVRLRKGRPEYIGGQNVEAAISTGADLVRNSSPYHVDGGSTLIGVWDDGPVLAEHQELVGRVTSIDPGTPTEHATHVAGTLCAAGVRPAPGMAPSLNILSFDWTFDLAEVAERAAAFVGDPGKIYLSNHSYGRLAGWETGPFSGEMGPHWMGEWPMPEDPAFGFYDEVCEQWDALCYASKFILPFRGAGNDRDDPAPTPGTLFHYFEEGWKSKNYLEGVDPGGDGWRDEGYDTIPTVATAKNLLTVGAVDDAVSAGLRSIDRATMSPFSGWGPTDDGRVKPDLVANGVRVRSTVASSNQSYLSLSGTSMATANAAGSAALLVDYYGQLFPGRAMKSSALKALLIHTADDLGVPGPDYSNGWGLLNVHTAAELLRRYSESEEGFDIIEGALRGDVPAAEHPIDLNGSGPLRVTLCWTDPPALPASGRDDPSSKLVVDLDLRVIDPVGDTVHAPFILDPLNPSEMAGRGDNSIDNVEMVLVENPTARGVYRAVVSTKNTLAGDSQEYSLVLQGAQIGSEEEPTPTRTATSSPTASPTSTPTQPPSPTSTPTKRGGPPETVRDLEARSGEQPGAYRVRFTAPDGDVEAEGDQAASVYDLRYDWSPIETWSDFLSAHPIPGLPVPLSGGGEEDLVVEGLPTSFLYFGLVATGTAGHGGISNIAWATESHTATVESPVSDARNLFFLEETPDPRKTRLSLFGRSKEGIPLGDAPGSFTLESFGEKWITRPPIAPGSMNEEFRSRNTIHVDSNGLDIPPGASNRDAEYRVEEFFQSRQIDYGRVRTRSVVTRNGATEEEIVDHRRHIFFPDRRFFVMVDEPQPSLPGDRRFSWNAHVLGTPARSGDGEVVVSKPSGARLVLRFSGPLADPQLTPWRDSPVALEEDVGRFDIASATVGDDHPLTSVLYPLAAAEVAPLFRSIPSRVGELFEVSVGEVRYLFFSRSEKGDPVLLDGELSVDGRMALAKIDSGQLDYLLVLEQTGWIAWRGKELFTPESTRSFLYIADDAERGGTTVITLEN